MSYLTEPLLLFLDRKLADDTNVIAQHVQHSQQKYCLNSSGNKYVYCHDITFLVQE